jgi:hypothetical protein
MDNLMPYACQSSIKYLVFLSLPFPQKGIRSPAYTPALVLRGLAFFQVSLKFNIFYSKLFIFPLLGIREFLKGISQVLFSSQLNTYLNLSTHDQNRTQGGFELDSNCSRTPVKRVFLMMD